MTKERDRSTFTEPPTRPLPKRPLGKTGHQVTIYGLGGLFTVARHDRHGEAVEIVNRALDLGVQLEENVHIASAFEPLSEEEMAEIRALARS